MAIGDLDSRLGERGQDGQPEPALDQPRLLEAGCPGFQLELQRRRPEAGEEDQGRGLADHAGVRDGGLAQDREDTVGVGAVGHAHADVHPAQAVGERQVGELLRGQNPVGDDDLGAVPGAHDAGADADVPDFSREVPDLHRVPHLEGALDEEDEPGDEVVHHRLQAEADADAERAHQDGDAVEIHPHGRHREDEAQQQDAVVEQGGYRVREPARQADARVDVLLEDEAD